MKDLTQILNKMTLEEKCLLLSGKNTWESQDYPGYGIPSIWMSDGPHGLRKQMGSADHLGLNASEKATCFPTAATIANSWDETLGERIGVALGEEAAAQDIHVLLGPGLNIKRSPLCGRNFEYFSEDPYLAGKMAAAYVRGIQSQGGSACPKHFAVNSQEERRMASNSVLDERTLREIYLTGFEIAVKEGGPRAIMSSYNLVNDEYANENGHLLMDILREEWGFDGAVITDWGGNNDHALGVKNGSSLAMPGLGLFGVSELLDAVLAGTLREDEINDRVLEMLKLIFETSEGLAASKKPMAVKEHHALAKEAAASSAVLLKNEGQLLPLKEKTRVAVLGDFAFTPRYQGAGSSVVNATIVSDASTSLRENGLEIVSSSRAFLRNGGRDERLLAEALQAAERAEVVLLYMGLDEVSESEGLDREHIRIHENQIDVLKAVSRINPNVVVVLNAGSAIDVSWEKYAQAILHGYLNGQAGAAAMAELLTGRVNPSGKLTETYPILYEDTPASHYYPGRVWNAEYREGLYIGYRYYDTAGVPVAYPFGYGLSYTSFEYSFTAADPTSVTFTLTNRGTVAGSEVAQVYVSKKDSEIFRPKKELKGFAKVELAAGESREVTVVLDDKAFRYFNVKTNRWEIEGGSYEILVGASSADIRIFAEVTVEGTNAPLPYVKGSLPSYESGQIKKVSDEEFAALLGRPIPENPTKIHKNSAFRDLKTTKSPLGRLVYHVLVMLDEKSRKKGMPDLNVLFIYNMPFRGLAMFAGGILDSKAVDGLVMELQGFWLIGLLRMLGAVIAFKLRSSKMARLLRRQPGGVKL